MDTHITISQDDKVIYTTEKPAKILRFSHNGLQIETGYYDKLIQSYFTRKLLDGDILPLQYNQCAIPQSPIQKYNKLKMVHITLEEELNVVIQDNKLIYCQTMGSLIFKQISKSLKIDVLQDFSKGRQTKTYDVSHNVCCRYRYKDKLPLRVIICKNKVVIENSEPNVRNFIVQIPVQNNVYHVNLACQTGNAIFSLENEHILWKIDHLSDKKAELNFELCRTNTIRQSKKQMVAFVNFEIDPLKHSEIDILKVYDNEGVKDGYVHKRMRVKNYEIRL